MSVLEKHLLEKQLIAKHQPGVSMHVLHRPIEPTVWYSQCQIIPSPKFCTIRLSRSFYTLVEKELTNYLLLLASIVVEHGWSVQS